MPRSWDNYEAAAYLEVKNPVTNKYVHVNYYTRLRDAFKGIERWLVRNEKAHQDISIIYS